MKKYRLALEKALRKDSLDPAVILKGRIASRKGVWYNGVEVEITANHDNTVTANINTQMTAEGNQTNFKNEKTLTAEDHVISSVIN